MTTETEYQNAVNYLTKLLNGGLMGERGSKPLRIAIEACELQIPKQPISKSWSPNLCPHCDSDYDLDGAQFLFEGATYDSVCHPRNSCLLSLRGIVGADQIVQWDTRYGEMTGKDNAICEE